MTKKLKNILKFIALIFMLIIVYSAIIEPSLLVVRRYGLDENGKSISRNIDIIEKNENKINIKIVHITDTQIGHFYSVNRLEKVVDRVNSLKPDIVAFTGDLIDYSTKNPDIGEITKQLSSIEASIGKFAVFGNHDYMYSLPKYYRQIMKESGFELLVNSNKRIKIGNDKYINVVGIDEILHGEPNVDFLERELNQQDFNLLLLHEPDLIDRFKLNNINLALAGHSHGGQIRIPIKGALITPPYGRKYTKGFYEINGNNIYVSSGLGSTKLPFRLFNTPEIVEFGILF